MKRRITTKGYLGLIVGLAAAVGYLSFGGPTDKPAAAQSKPTRQAPTEEINVELAVDFPYDI